MIQQLTRYILTFFAACISEDAGNLARTSQNKVIHKRRPDKRTNQKTTSAYFIYPSRRDDSLRTHAKVEDGKEGGSAVQAPQRAQDMAYVSDAPRNLRAAHHRQSFQSRSHSTLRNDPIWRCVSLRGSSLQYTISI